MAAGLLKIREEILADKELSDRIVRKYGIRNTSGYAMHAFLDGETPVEILRRLMVGSEGTLGFVAEAVYKTYHLPARTTVAWLPFDTIDAAVEQVGKLVELGAQAVELMVASAMTAASKLMKGTPKYWKDLDPKNAALLVEFGFDSVPEFEAIQKRVGDALRDVKMLQPLEFIRESKRLSWHGTFVMVCSASSVKCVRKAQTSSSKTFVFHLRNLRMRLVICSAFLPNTDMNLRPRGMLLTETCIS